VGSAQAQGSCAADDIRCVALEIHNTLRAETNVAPLVWDDKLATASQKWADNRFTSANPVEHDPALETGIVEHMSAAGSPVGSGAPTIANRIEAWFSSAHRNGMVNPDNVKIGCGTAAGTYADANVDRRVVVCRYSK
jgi:uncharacterized protein YkwD